MLREGLAEEFPFAARALGSIPRRFVVSREDPRWAAVSAFGVAWLVAAAGNAVATPARAAGFRETALWIAAGFLISGPTGTKPILSAGGAVVLSQTVLFGLWRLTATPTGDPIANLGISLGFVASGMLAAGAIIRRRATGSRPLITFAIIATTLWLSGQWPLVWGILNGAYVVSGVLVLYPILIGPVEIAALFLGWMLLLPGADDRGGL